jgi:phosphonopyruvate decarboxylase
MIEPDRIINILATLDVTFFAGVPDSLLSGFSAGLLADVDDTHHVTVANEGNAVALAAGHYLATGQVPCVYLQNSGLGNIINPLVSLADPAVYGIPMVLLIGWRGEPGVEDEPQHIRQGELTKPLLDVLDIPTFILSGTEISDCGVMRKAVNLARSRTGPVAVLVGKNIIAPQALPPVPEPVAEISREKVIELIVAALGDGDAVISTTGKISRELYEIRERQAQGHEHDFLVVGSMGHASQIAAGVALGSGSRRVVCLDGDGALIMHMGSLAVNGALDLPNFYHIVLNNGCHDSVGGMPTVGLDISVHDIASACGYNWVGVVDSAERLSNILPEFFSQVGPCLLNIVVNPGSRSDLGRPAIAPVDCKNNFMHYLQCS